LTRLSSRSGAYPELMAELDAIKRELIGGLMLRRDWGDQRPRPTEKGSLGQNEPDGQSGHVRAARSDSATQSTWLGPARN
jgi:hypothetical protein